MNCCLLCLPRDVVSPDESFETTIDRIVGIEIDESISTGVIRL